MGLLPLEVWIEITKYCDTEALLPLRATCIELHRIVDELGIIESSLIVEDDEVVLAFPCARGKVAKGLNLDDFELQNENGLSFWILTVTHFEFHFGHNLDSYRVLGSVLKTLEQRRKLIYRFYLSFSFRIGYQQFDHFQFKNCAGLITNCPANFQVEVSVGSLFTAIDQVDKVPLGHKFSKINMAIPSGLHGRPPWEWVEFVDGHHIDTLTLQGYNRATDFSHLTSWLHNVSIGSLILDGVPITSESQLKEASGFSEGQIMHVDDEGDVMIS